MPGSAQLGPPSRVGVTAPALSPGISTSSFRQTRQDAMEKASWALSQTPPPPRERT